MEKRFTAAIPREWIEEKVKVLTSPAFAGDIRGVLREIGADYIIVEQDIINIEHIVKIRKA
jgi:hypothetical protein